MKMKMITIPVMLLLLVVGFALYAGTPAGTVFAAPSEGNAVADDADGSGSGDAYKYRVTVYAGAQGTYKGASEVSSEYALNDLVEIDLKDVVVTNDKYYARGFRIAGHDNDETTGIARITFNATTDVSYEVAYGIKGSMVAYSISYVDESGKELLPSDTYYGMVGDKPVVSFRYIEGYLPNAFSEGKTLSDNAADNVFTFTYRKSGTEENENGGQNAADNGGAGGAAGAGAAGAGAVAIAPGTAGNPAGTNVGNAGNTTIGDNDTPLASPDQYQDLDKTGLGQMLWLLILIGVVALAIILFILRWLMKKRGEEEDETYNDAG